MCSSLRSEVPHTREPWSLDPPRRTLDQLCNGAADHAEVVAAGDRAPELLDAEMTLERYDPGLPRHKRTQVHARGILRYLTVRDDAQHGGILLGVAPLQFGRLRDLFPGQRAGTAFGLVAGRRDAAGVLFVALVSPSAVDVLAFLAAPER